MTRDLLERRQIVMKAWARVLTTWMKHHGPMVKWMGTGPEAPLSFYADGISIYVDHWGRNRLHTVFHEGEAEVDIVYSMQDYRSKFCLRAAGKPVYENLLEFLKTQEAQDIYALELLAAG
jgi:hypothetical protein